MREIESRDGASQGEAGGRLASVELEARLPREERAEWRCVAGMRTAPRCGVQRCLEACAESALRRDARVVEKVSRG